MEWNPARTGALSRSSQLAPGEPYLPLSWRIENGLDHPRIQRVSLPGNLADWLAFGSVPFEYSPRQLAQWICHTQGSRPFVLRGSHPAFLAWLQPAGGQVLLTGREALLDLHADHLGRKSLRELARRGRRHGEITQFGRQDLATVGERVDRFMERVRSTYSAPLSYLYRTRLPESERFFVLENAERIFGLVSLIPNGPASWHTELLARDPAAPVGIMEALIGHVFATLRDEGAAYWSLGEVPFYPTAEPDNLKALALTQVGQRLDRAYSALGLYRFKAKFHPIWRPVCVYGWPSMSWLTLAGMFWRCNGHKLMAVGLRLMAGR
ncbi:MAG TPA: phosphatidylglycerol lysyltransferase domain-containing protein [Candidatus Obscuribacterales bacterium]